MINSAKSWYALSTKRGCEKKVSNILTRKNIDNYCPLKRSGASPKKMVIEPLFISLVFVYTDQHQISVLCKNDYIINVVYWLGKPAIIQSEEIDIMKRFLNEYANVKIEKIPLTLSGMTKMYAASKAEYNIQMVSVKNNAVKIILASLGYTIVAEFDGSNVELVKSAAQSFTMIENYKYAI